MLYVQVLLHVNGTGLWALDLGSMFIDHASRPGYKLHADTLLPSSMLVQFCITIFIKV